MSDVSTTPAPRPAVDSAALDRAISLAREAVGADGALAVLVLFDPAATTCHRLSQLGDTVACVPDLQGPLGDPAGHAEIVCAGVEDLVREDREWDLAILTTGFSRYLAVNTEAAVNGLVTWLRSHAEVVIFEAPRNIIDPVLNDLGPYASHPVLSHFTFLGELADEIGESAQTPLILASDHHLFTGDGWVSRADVVDLDTRDWTEARDSGRWTLHARDDLVVKVECVSEDYFDRCQATAEHAFLTSVPPSLRESLRLPAPLSLNRGRSVVTIVREHVPGIQARAGDRETARRVMEGVLDLASRYAEASLFHNDLRPWNVLWDGESASFIDFADASNVDEDVHDLPQILALAGTLASIAGHGPREGEGFREDVLQIADESGALSVVPLNNLYGAPWLALATGYESLALDADLPAGELFVRLVTATAGRPTSERATP